MTQTVEIVTFRLKSGVDEAVFAQAAEALMPFLQGTGAMTSRVLSCNDQGVWTDHLTWTSLEAAKEAAAEMFEQPQAGPFMAMIDETKMSIHHAPIALRSG